MPTDKDTYNQIRSAQYEAPFKQALRYFYLNKTAYSGLMRYNSKGEFNTPYGNYKNPNFEITQEQIKLIKRTEIYNCDFREIPITYKKDDFCFIDPPYSGTWGGYNKVLFTDEDQEDLYHWFLNNLAKVMIVINKVPFIESLYKRYIKDEYNITYGIDVKNGQKKVKTHLIITNY
jgi:DNA adenine methylase